MATFPFAMQVWGSLRSPKRALLLHGGEEAATVWNKVAKGLVEAGYRVDALDQEGRGWVGETCPDRSWRTQAKYLAGCLEPDAKYDLFCGISFGSMLALQLLPLLPHPPARFFMVNTLLDDGYPIGLPGMAQRLRDKTNTIQDYMEKNGGDEMEATAAKLRALQVDPDLLGTLFDIEQPRDIWNQLPSEEASKGTAITMLLNDIPKRSPGFQANVRKILEQKPHVRVGYRAEGWSHHTRPDVFVKVLVAEDWKDSDSLMTRAKVEDLK